MKTRQVYSKLIENKINKLLENKINYTFYSKFENVNDQDL